jgi:hypothetical protein
MQIYDWVEKYVGVTVHAKRCKVLENLKNALSYYTKNIRMWDKNRPEQIGF